MEYFDVEYVRTWQTEDFKCVDENYTFLRYAYVCGKSIWFIHNFRGWEYKRNNLNPKIVFLAPKGHCDSQPYCWATRWILRLLSKQTISFRFCTNKRYHVIVAVWTTACIHPTCCRMFVSRDNPFFASYGIQRESIWQETKWTPFRRRHFQVHFREWKCLNYNQNLTEVCS